MSHLQIWERLVKDFGQGLIDDSPVAVFEDDAVLLVDESDFIEAWDVGMRSLPGSVSFLWLNTTQLYPQKPPRGPCPVTVVGGYPARAGLTCTTEAYLVRPSFAKALFDAITNDMGAVDVHMARVLSAKKQDHGLTHPLFCQRDRNDSDIQKFEAYSQRGRFPPLAGEEIEEGLKRLLTLASVLLVDTKVMMALRCHTATAARTRITIAATQWW